MKNALLVYPRNDQGTFNIGDYVQSIAARQFLPSVDLYIHREHLNDQQKEDLRLILNGWFMHNPENWPPCEKIHPLFVAFHMNKLAETAMLSPEGIDYLKKHEPIGCRDRYTESLLKSKGIEAYFSGCMTLTLGRTYRHKEVENPKIYFTDLNSTLAHTPEFKIKCLWAVFTKIKLLRKIQKKMLGCGIKRAMRTVAAFYVTYQSVMEDDLFATAEYRAHEIPDTFADDDAKFKYADQLLREYSEAKFVVTSRIHCALPCLGIGTPVVFVTNDLLGEIHNCRLDGLKQLFHRIEITREGVTSKLPGNSKLNSHTAIQNKEDYKPIAEKLIAKCRQFVGS
ncbi:MAG: polysaccharide pyruvyl transferase family protein [Muribaculum sp.]|nr:polysaccharide pyruvyl transferase family protein [Muribaculum sp.]